MAVPKKKSSVSSIKKKSYFWYKNQIQINYIKKLKKLYKKHKVTTIKPSIRNFTPQLVLRDFFKQQLNNN